MRTPEQQARDMLERLGVDDAQQFWFGDLLELANMINDLHKLRSFAQAVMEAWPDGGIEGGDLQEIAEKHGMLAQKTMAAPCGDGCRCVEYFCSDDWQRGVMCYRRTSLLTGELT